MAIYNHTGPGRHRPRAGRSGSTRRCSASSSGTRSPLPTATAKLSCLTPPLGITASYLTLDGFVLELMHYAAPGATAPFRERTMNEPGLTHLSISVDDVRATAERVAEYGGADHRGE